jgi:hypothetical protein
MHASEWLLDDGDGTATIWPRRRAEALGPRRCAMDRNGDSPAEIAERIFAASPYPAIRRLKCSFRDGELVIAGTVASFYHKQLAQITAQKLDGVERISNIVEVVK